MTEIIEAGAHGSVHTLRAALEKAERQILHLDRSNINGFLELLDEIERTFLEFGPDQSSLRAEEGRWESLRSRIDAKPQVLVAAAAQAGGLAKLRAQHPPATGPWWHLDTVVAQRRSRSLKRTGITVVAVIAVVSVALWAINAFTPAQGSLTAATSQIEELVTAQKLPEALAAVEKARQTLPNDPELLVWDSVLAEQLGDAARAQASLTLAQQKFTGQPAAFWILVGNHRQQVGNLAGAEAAGLQALALAPQSAEANFLMGGVAEARGDIVQAADYFSKTVALAADTNPALSVTAKVRLGYLMPRVDPLQGGQTITQTLTPQSP